MTNKAGLVCLGVFVSVLPAALSAQQSELTDVSIQGSVYEPQRLSPTLRVGNDAARSSPRDHMIYRVAAAGTAASADPQVLAKQIFDAPSTIAVSSAAIPAGGTIDVKYSDYGKGISPPLQWSSLPSGTRSVVLMMEDPDSVSPLPFVHWTMINLPPSLGALPANVDKAFQPLRGQPVRQGSNSKSERGYFGPRPPVGDPPHHYHFQIFALDTRLDLSDGFNRHALLQAMRGHVLAQGELVGMFQAPQ